ncbi:hypothetical protein ACKXGD_17650, partial [Enterococcus lactis]|uniref:hypothetical protein n=1 Tax=Enterococcus lactis TaxID=357441 RepID=UPI003908344E
RRAWAFLLWLLLCVRQFTRAAVFGNGHSPVGTHQCRVGESQNDHVEIVRRHLDRFLIRVVFLRANDIAAIRPLR